MTPPLLISAPYDHPQVKSILSITPRFPLQGKGKQRIIFHPGRYPYSHPFSFPASLHEYLFFRSPERFRGLQKDIAGSALVFPETIGIFLKGIPSEKSSLSPTTTPASGTAEKPMRNLIIESQVEFPEKVLEAEASGDIFLVKSSPQLPGTEPVIGFSLFRVTQDRIRLTYLLDLSSDPSCSGFLSG